MLDRIHEARTGEFRRILRACAIAASRGRHALVLLVPRGQDPDGFLRAFHRHCRDKAGRPVRLLTMTPGPRPSAMERMRSLLGLPDGPVVSRDAPLTDMLGAADCLFERLTDAVASELATDDTGIGPGLLMIEGDLAGERTLQAFLGHLSPPTAQWRSLTTARPRPRQFLALAAIPVSEDGEIRDLPDGLETLAVRPLHADDLKAAADAATEILLDGLAGQPGPQVGDFPLRPVRRDGPSTNESNRDRVCELLESGSFQDLLSGDQDLDITTRIRCLVAAGRPDEAINAGLEPQGEPNLDLPFLLQMGALATTRANGEAVSAFAAQIASRVTPDDRSLDSQLALLKAEQAFLKPDFEEALVLAETALGHADLDRDRDNAHNMLGKIAFRTGRHGEARKWFTKTASTAEPGSVERARAVHNLGLTALRLNHFGKAVSHLQEAVLAADEAGEAFGGALARHNLAIALEFQGRYQPAFEFALDSLDRLVRLGRQANVPGAFTTLADLLLTFGDWDRALSLVNEAREQATRHGLEQVLALCAQKEGECLLLKGEPDSAMESLLEAYRAFDEAGLQDDAAYCASRLAEASFASGDLERAYHWATTVVDMGRRDGDESRGRALLIQGRLAMALEGPAQGLRILERARKDLNGADQREPMAQLCMAMAEASETLDDGSAAESLLEEARSLVEDLLDSVPGEYRKICVERPGLLEILGDTADAAGPDVATGRTDAPRPIQALPSRPRLRQQVPHIVGDSEALRHVLVTIERIRNIPVPVLLLGESGTGKELFAGAVHSLSNRSERPFVRVNAAAFTDTLLLSELFGHEKGAFTGAHTRRIGRFEAAHGGTLLLDEIGDVSEQLQTALLRVIEEQSFERVGGNETVHVDVRLVFSTNRDLQKLMRQGRFREDLFHRISGVTIPVPPLKDRLDDVPALVDMFLAELECETGRRLSLDENAPALLTSYRWPGNIRELKNVIRKTGLMIDGETLTREALLREAPDLARSARDRPEGSLDLFDMVFGRGASLFEARRELEVALIREALTQAEGNISAAAQLLGMKRPRLSQMVKDYGLKDLKARKAGEVP